MGAVFLGGLGHEADVGDGAHGLRIERAVLAAEVDDGLIDAGVGGIRDDGEGVLEFPGGIPHLPGGADHGGHRGIDDHVGRDVKVGDALVGVDHGERGAVFVSLGNVRLDLRFLVGGEGLDFCDEIAEAVVVVDAEGGERLAVFRDEIAEENFHGVAENDRVADLHHGGFHVEGEQDTGVFRLGDLLVEKDGESVLREESSVQDLTGEERGGFLEDGYGAIGGDEFDLRVGGGGDGDGFLVGEEIALPCHRADAGLRVLAPCAHGVRVLAGVFLDGFRRAAVGVALAEDGVDGGAHDLRVTGAGFLVLIGGRVFRESRDGETFALKFGDGLLELRDGGGNVGELDDVRVRAEGHRAEFGQMVGDLLIHGEKIGELGEDAAGEGDVARFHKDASRFREGLDDGEERVGRERGRLVGLGVDDGVGHGGGI